MFELCYSTGGHGGPYRSVFAAKTSALKLLAGNQTEKWIDIRSRHTEIVVARITRENLQEFFKMGEAEKPIKLTALFHISAYVELNELTDAVLNNSKVLHPDVLDALKAMINEERIAEFQITLVDAFEYGTKGGSENG